jgi:putative hydrolase of the HAD superfamily
MYKFLIFDADNTLFDFSKSEAEALEKTSLFLGIETFEPESHIPLYKKINIKIWKEFEEGEISSERLKTERFRRYINALNFDASPEKMSSVYLTNLSQSVYLIPGALEVVSALYPQKHMCMITNGLTSVQKPRIESSGIKSYFSAILISEEIGIAKPDRQIFRLAMDKIGSEKKEEILMIGDNLNSDIRGGLNFGIDTCWYNPSKESNPTDIFPTYEISLLKELFAIVD